MANCLRLTPQGSQAIATDKSFAHRTSLLFLGVNRIIVLLARRDRPM